MPEPDELLGTLLPLLLLAVAPPELELVPLAPLKPLLEGVVEPEEEPVLGEPLLLGVPLLLGAPLLLGVPLLLGAVEPEVEPVEGELELEPGLVIAPELDPLPSLLGAAPPQPANPNNIPNTKVFFICFIICSVVSAVHLATTVFNLTLKICT